MSNFDIFNWQPSAEEIAQFAETLRETQGGRQLLELVDTGTITPAAAPAAAEPAAAAPAAAEPPAAAPAGATTYDPTQQRVVPVEQARVVTNITPPTTRTAPPVDPYAGKRRYYTASSKVVTENGRRIQIVTDIDGNETRTDIGPAEKGDGTGATGTGARSTKTVVTTDQFVRNGRRILRTTYTDGSVTDEDLGAENEPDTSREDAAAAQRRESAFTLIQSFLKRANLSGLDTTIRGLLSEGIEDVNAVMFRLRDTPEFQKRFRANAARAANGLPELDFATYTGLEQSYRETMQAFGLPMGFYDDQTDFEKLIEGDVSIAELTTRIRDGFVKVRDADPEVKRQMQELYGVSDTDLAAYFIDPKRARPLMMAQDYKRQAAAAQIAARGVEQGGMQLSKQEAEALAARGITGEEAQTQFTQQRQLAGLFEELAGEQALTREQKLGVTFGYDVQAQEELRRRAQRRVAQFQVGGSFASTRGQTSGTIETGLGGPQ